jgi:hypothetical protein
LAVHPARPGNALAGKSTLNRLERTAIELESSERNQKMVYDATAIKVLFTDLK